MGAYLLYNIEFPNREERDKFEKQEKLKRMFQYNSSKRDIKEGGKEYYDCTYYPTWEGYAEPQGIIKRCKKNKIKITKFLSVDLSTQTSWYDEIKEMAYEDKE